MEPQHFPSSGLSRVRDGSVAGRSEDLLLFFKQLTEHGSYFGHSVNAPKSQLIVKEASKIKALKLIEGTPVETESSPQNAYPCLTKGAQQKLNFVPKTTPNSRKIFTDADAYIQMHVPLSFFDSPVSQSARRLYSLPTREGRLNIREPISYEMEDAASLTTCLLLKMRIEQMLISTKNA